MHATSNSTTTQRWQDFALGKVVQVGATQYVKVGDDQWLAMENPLCNDPVLLYPGSSKSFSYTGDAQSYTFYKNCQYRVELWGASGGAGGWPGNFRDRGGYGGYVSGKVVAKNNSQLSVYIGQVGNNAVFSPAGALAGVSWNGGGSGVADTAPNDGGGSGGGASDIRITGGDWNNAGSLRSRIIVAAGGGGGGVVNTDQYTQTSSGGGLIGVGNVRHWSNVTISEEASKAYMGTQISGYSFGIGGNGYSGGEGGGGGGGGWYGGKSFDGNGTRYGSGGGGSSYISGHIGCVAVTSTSDSTPKSGCTTGTTDNSCSISPYGYTFTDTVMIDGAGYAWTNVKGALQAMPNPAGGYYASGVGHTGNGAARITRLN